MTDSEQEKARKERASRVALGALAALVTLAFVLHAWWLSGRELQAAVLSARGWIELLASDATAVALVFGPFVAVLLVVVGLLVNYGMPRVWPLARPSLQVGALLGACLAAAWFIGTAGLDHIKNLSWLFFLPVVPPALLAFQALITWRQRPRSVGEFRLGVSRQLQEALEASGDAEQFRSVHDQLLRVFGGIARGNRAQAARGVREDASRPGSFSPASFATQFAVPGLLLLLVGFGVLALAVNGEIVSKAQVPMEAVRGLRWGVAGAYVYVLFTFGSRSFRNDLTVGAAIWAIVTLIVGPALAVVLALVWKMNATDTGAWQTAVVLFFAGLAPRRVMNIVESVALQFLRSPNETTSKLIPLTTLRGISPELAIRLKEENIEDVVGLAYADPIRLVQSVPYDLRQVIEWIDQAQLAVALPEQYELLTQRGITGSIDLAWRWLQASATTLAKDADAEDVPLAFKRLVREPEREAPIIYECARQMFYEEHVRLLWVMYNSFSTAAGDLDLSQARADENRVANGGGSAKEPLDAQEPRKAPVSAPAPHHNGSAAGKAQQALHLGADSAAPSHEGSEESQAHLTDEPIAPRTSASESPNGVPKPTADGQGATPYTTG